MSWQADYTAHLDGQAFAEEIRLRDLADDARGFQAPSLPEPDPMARYRAELKERIAKCKALTPAIMPSL